jgi:subtilisin family serine protease
MFFIMKRYILIFTLALAFTVSQAQAANIGAQFDIAGVTASWTMSAHPTTIALLDSYVPNGPEFGSRLQHGLNCADATGAGTDPLHHGEALASLMGAAANNIGITGIDPNVDIIAYDVTVNGQADSNCIIAALLDAASRGIKIANLSFSAQDLGNPQVSAALAQTIADVRAQGMIVVGAAGNWLGPVGDPARDPGMLAVSAIGYASGPQIKVLAPGSGITTTDAQGQVLPNVNAGTSLAAAEVSAALAILFSQDPSLTSNQALAAITDGGVLNVKRALSDLNINEPVASAAQRQNIVPSLTKISQVKFSYNKSKRTILVRWTKVKQAKDYRLQAKGRQWVVRTNSLLLSIPQTIKHFNLTIQALAGLSSGPISKFTYHS